MAIVMSCVSILGPNLSNLISNQELKHNHCDHFLLVRVFGKTDLPPEYFIFSKFAIHTFYFILKSFWRLFVLWDYEGKVKICPAYKVLTKFCILNVHLKLPLRLQLLFSYSHFIIFSKICQDLGQRLENLKEFCQIPNLFKGTK